MLADAEIAELERMNEETADVLRTTREALRSGSPVTSPLTSPATPERPKLPEGPTGETPVHVRLQMSELYKQINLSRDGFDLADGRRLATVVHSEPTSGQVFALFDAIKGDPGHVNEELFGKFMMRTVDTCFCLLASPETGMIDRAAAQDQLGEVFQSPEGHRPAGAGFQMMLNYTQFVTYVVSEFRRAVSTRQHHVTLSSLYNIAHNVAHKVAQL